MNKNDILEIRITDLTAEGEGVGRAGTFPLFIKDTCIGDLVRVKVMKLKKTYGYARLLEILEPSETRRMPACEKAAACGGCQIQQMDYSAQLKMKTNKVKNNLIRIGGFSLEDGMIEYSDCLGMENEWRYRNKASVPFGYAKDGTLVYGFYAGRTHDIISMEDCRLAPPEVCAVTKAVAGHMEKEGIRAYDERTGQGLVRHVLFRKGFATGEIMVTLVLNGRKLPAAGILIQKLQEIPGIKTFCINVNTENTNVILGKETHALFGPGYIEDLIGDVRFRISPNSFYQVNPQQTCVLYSKALEFAGLTGNENVWDLYCGIGTISLFLAKKAKKVYGVEIVPQAIVDARQNAALNGIHNAEFYTGKAEEVLPDWYSAHVGEKIDVICVDPPRKGCDEKCLKTILKIMPSRIVYVSCDSATLARDLKILCASGYRLTKVQPVDMFPETIHVETVVLMSKVKG